jgi:hypothetical protein
MERMEKIEGGCEWQKSKNMYGWEGGVWQLLNKPELLYK